MSKIRKYAIWQEQTSQHVGVGDKCGLSAFPGTRNPGTGIRHTWANIIGLLWPIGPLTNRELAQSQNKTRGVRGPPHLTAESFCACVCKILYMSTYSTLSHNFTFWRENILKKNRMKRAYFYIDIDFRAVQSDTNIMRPCIFPDIYK